MIRRPPRSTLDRSSAASDVYKRQVLDVVVLHHRSDVIDTDVVGQIEPPQFALDHFAPLLDVLFAVLLAEPVANLAARAGAAGICLLYTSDAADERSSVDLGGRRIIKKKNK